MLLSFRMELKNKIGQGFPKNLNRHLKYPRRRGGSVGIMIDLELNDLGSILARGKISLLSIASRLPLRSPSLLSNGYLTPPFVFMT
jgi:hypothetical protein